MSVQHALKFIQRAGQDAMLKDRIRTLGSAIDRQTFVAIGATVGLAFTVDEFNTAFARDWAMRRYYYCGGTGEGAEKPPIRSARPR